MENDDELLFAAEEETPQTAFPVAKTPRKPWKIMIVDDEPEVHTITRLALSGFEFEGRPLQFISARSGAEAKALFSEHPDIAMVLLDVVMETEDAGLDVVRYIRDQINNRMTRIILRTGQPGQAPERRVVLEYDINDYKTKTELTAQKLFTSIVAGLRAYADLEIIEQNRRGLEEIINASASIFKIQSMERFVQGVLTQLVSLLRLGENSFCGSGCFASHEEQSLRIIAGTGAFSEDAGKRIEDVLQTPILDDVNTAIVRHENHFSDEYIVLCFMSSNNRGVIYLENSFALNVFDKDLLNLFCANVSVALDNLKLANELERTQREVVERIGAVAETRSEETGNHVRRVAEYCYLLAQAVGMDEAEAQMLKEAAPMHDIGKVGIPDSILNKPGKLSAEEFEIMKKHAELGKKLLSNSKSRLLDASAIVAYEHHECWDGSGYPRGLKGTEIHIYGRITAIADVFDALGSPRCYKGAWTIDKVFAYMYEQRERQFDPDLVDRFLEHREKILEIRESFKD
ncbi:MAG: DUF3369 domain-containing protein [Betaproteobacteria bacterium]|nr:DUF3369 domain-containing protein [Betaproteobacteria bacterium]